MRIFLPAVSTVMAAMLAGCALQSQPLPLTGSTQGSTLVQKAVVTDVRDIAFNDARHSVVGSIAGGFAGQQAGIAGSAKRITRLTVRSDDGEISTCDVESSEIFRVGEPVKVISNNGNVTVTH
jgi:outer membrane lipoprotein SlyB